VLFAELCSFALTLPTVIAGKTQETNYQVIAKKVSKLVTDYNQSLIDELSGKAARRS